MLGSNKGGFQWHNWNLKTGYKPIQWRSTVFAPLCAFCDKPVYPAEEVVGGGKKFHKFCLKCISCNTLLNTSNLNEHEKKIYCISCYRRQFGPRASLNFRASSSLSLNTPISSPRLINTHQYERQTSIGSSPSRTSSDDDLTSIHKVKYLDTITLQKLNSRPLTTFKMVSLSKKNICPRCTKPVYLAEEVKAAGKSFHKQCYSCANCKGGINGGRYSEHNGEIYDNNCYQRLFGPKGIRSPRH